MIKFVKDADAIRMTNGEPLEVTETVYRTAPRLWKWCLTCHRVTEHLSLPEGLKSGRQIACNEESGDQ